MEFEDILKEVGNWGKYQKLIIYVLLLPLSFLLSFEYSSVMFQTVVPNYWCHVPKTNRNMSYEQWKNISIPRKPDGDFESCLRYKRNPESVNTSDLFSEETMACDIGWDFDNSTFESTIPTSLEWYCDKETYAKHAMSVRFTGNALGTVILPTLADKYTGRRMMFFIGMGIRYFFLLFIPWITNPILHVVTRFFCAFPLSTIYQMCYVIIVEILSSKKRSMTSSLSFQWWTLGMCALSLFGLFFSNWKILAYTSLIPSLMAIPMWIYLPESPRWLITKNKINEATDVLNKIAKMNGKSINRDEIKKKLEIIAINEREKEEQKGNGEEISFITIFYNKKIFYRFCILVLLSITSSMSYGCVILNINVLPNQYFLNFFILSIVEIPSNFTGWLGTQYLGRRFTTYFTFFLTSLIAFIAIFYIDDKVALLALSAIIKLLCVQAIYVYYLYIPEVLPTPIRSAGMGFVVVAGSLFMTACPYMIPPNVSESFQYIFIAITMLLSAIASTFLPETLGIPLPQTFYDAQNLAKGRRYFSFIHYWNLHKFSTPSENISSNSGKYDKYEVENNGDPDNEESKEKLLSYYKSDGNGIEEHTSDRAIQEENKQENYNCEKYDKLDDKINENSEKNNVNSEYNEENEHFNHTEDNINQYSNKNENIDDKYNNTEKTGTIEKEKTFFNQQEKDNINLEKEKRENSIKSKIISTAGENVQYLETGNSMENKNEPNCKENVVKTDLAKDLLDIIENMHTDQVNNGIHDSNSENTCETEIKENENEKSNDNENNEYEDFEIINIDLEK